ncbi:Cytosine-specific methyltransferase [Pseudomonas tremae]|uniref:Cytosine-specific methyltransferase n=1 Tax=Pseudomonas tremae TaxID=200454 RepID=A0AA40P0E0_9PSED|nr:MULTISPECIES: hypothetical protein [Pseudomonas syringae group]KPY92147.1 Cytosine-specific methyltransferase [Pseudomonas tremae]RMO03344.1 hypothetical protein ALQ48_03898 [Pseudomonas coronafaciens pv. zizaniae]
MINFLWRLLAKLLARPAIAAWLITSAQRTPYLHIRSADGQEVYMGRWWLFNAYDRETHLGRIRWCAWSIRVHHIMRPDADRDLHDHPWDARTVILRGFYKEQRRYFWPASDPTDLDYWREAGDTARLNHGEYHRIDKVSPGGVYTLFITSRWKGDWGFLVNGVKVAWREYTGEKS